MRILLISVYPFPIGLSATNRILSYSKGLIERGHAVKYLCLRPTEHRGRVVNENSQGTYAGIEYEYLCGTTVWSDYRVIKAAQAFIGFVKAFYVLCLNAQKKHYDYVIISNDNVYLILPLTALLKYILRKKSILIVDEYPMVLRERIRFYQLFPFMLNLEMKIGYRLFNGIITMTYPLQDYFVPLKGKLCNMQVIPMTVEPERFNFTGHSKLKYEKYVAYVGDLVAGKDGVENAISAFSLISEKYPDLKFYIIGSAKSSLDYENLQKQVKELNLEERIKFTGQLQRDAVPEYICHAVLLILTRPNNVRAQGGFPTKLGEYLATGNPVVVTSVGDIPKYLIDGENAFVSNSADPTEFSLKMDQALSNPEVSKAIGVRGRDLAYGIFNYKVQAKNIEHFLSRL
jgi:glycosyltransferase involved in cell wall biosynthesis